MLELTCTKAALSASMADTISAEVERTLMRTATRASAADTTAWGAPAAAAATDGGAEKGSSCPVAISATVALSKDWPVEPKDEGG